MPESSTNTTAAFELPEGTPQKTIVETIAAVNSGAVDKMDSDHLLQFVQHLGVAVMKRAAAQVSEFETSTNEDGDEITAHEKHLRHILATAVMLNAGFLTLSQGLQGEALQLGRTGCQRPGCDCHVQSVGLSLIVDQLRNAAQRQAVSAALNKKFGELFKGGL